MEVFGASGDGGEGVVGGVVGGCEREEEEEEEEEEEDALPAHSLLGVGVRYC